VPEFPIIAAEFVVALPQAPSVRVSLLTVPGVVAAPLQRQGFVAKPVSADSKNGDRLVLNVAQFCCREMTSFAWRSRVWVIRFTVV
jgi:hypothetical protein